MTTYYSCLLYSVHSFINSDYLLIQIIEVIQCPSQYALASSVAIANPLAFTDCIVDHYCCLHYLQSSTSLALCFLYLNYTKVLKLHVHYLEHKL